MSPIGPAKPRACWPANEDIHEAAQTGNVATPRRLLQSEPKLITTTNQAGETPLRLAARNRQADAVETLLAAGSTWDEVSAAMNGIPRLSLASWKMLATGNLRK